MLAACQVPTHPPKNDTWRLPPQRQAGLLASSLEFFYGWVCEARKLSSTTHHIFPCSPHALLRILPHTPLGANKKSFDKKLRAQKLKISSLTRSVRSSREARVFFCLKTTLLISKGNQQKYVLKKRLRPSLRVPEIKKFETLVKMCGFLLAPRGVYLLT